MGSLVLVSGKSERRVARRWSRTTTRHSWEYLSPAFGEAVDTPRSRKGRAVAGASAAARVRCRRQFRGSRTAWWVVLAGSALCGTR